MPGTQGREPHPVGDIRRPVLRRMVSWQHRAVERGLQERAARAQPAELVEEVEGWWLRHAPGCDWWVGTVLPHSEDDEPHELIGRVAGAEAFYAGHGAPTRVQITPGACPPQLDGVLARRGYRRESPISLQVARTASVRQRAPAGRRRLRLDDTASPSWLSVGHAGRHRADRHRADRQRAMLDRVHLPSVYAGAVSDDNVVVSVGRAVVDDGWAGVFSMTTQPAARGRGAALEVIGALAEWAGQRGVDTMYLQVEKDNVAAMRLYQRAGFGELCSYHYRTAPDRTTEAGGGR